MNAFELARKKYEKNKERQARTQADVDPVKKEEPKVIKRAGPMVVLVSGPVNLRFEIDYAGTLISSQSSEEALKAMFKKQLSVMGRVL